MTIQLSKRVYIPIKYAETILVREQHRLVADYCPNSGAYMVDRRRRRMFRVPSLSRMLVIEDGGNIAAGEEPEAWLE